jgi:hypothetical protein
MGAVVVSEYMVGVARKPGSCHRWELLLLLVLLAQRTTLQEFSTDYINSSTKLSTITEIIAMTSTKVLNSIDILLDIIDRQDWRTFRFAALSNSAYFRAITNAIANCPETNGMTLLHAVVRCNPPLDLVAKMMEICPDLPAAKDCLGRTPLHVAAGSAATPNLIKLIAHAHPASCDATDDDGKTPLHFVCDSSCELFEDDDIINQSREVCHDTIRALLSESMHAATIEDVDEMNAIEYAIMSDAQLKTISLLQMSARKSFESSRLRRPPLPPAIDIHHKVDVGTRSGDNNDNDTDVVMEDVAKEKNSEEEVASRKEEKSNDDEKEEGDAAAAAPVRVSYREDEIIHVCKRFKASRFLE